jgi:hypothetical protein
MATRVPPPPHGPPPPPPTFTPPPLAPAKVRHLKAWHWMLIGVGQLLFLSMCASLLGGGVLGAIGGASTSTQPTASSQQTAAPTHTSATQAPRVQAPVVQPTQTPTAIPTATPKPAPTATPKPAPSATPKPAPARFTLAITYANIVAHTSGKVSVYTLPGAALTIRVHYNQTNRDATSNSLKGTRYANSNGNYTWTWTVGSTATGTATVTVTATWHGQTITVSKNVQMQ